MFLHIRLPLTGKTAALVFGLVLLQAPAVRSAEPAFQALFNGQDLSGWEGDPRFWRVEQGVIVGETTEVNPAEHNTFLIYRPREFGNFELRFSYRVRGYNSGVQYRSVDQGDWVVRGYQADFEDRWHENGQTDQYSGMFFEELGRMFLAQRGDVVVVHADPENPEQPRIEKIGSVGNPAALEKAIRRDDWNEYIVIADGYQFTHLINGHVMAMGFDRHEAQRRASGILAFQLHAGPPMRIELKDIRIRELD